MKIKQNWWLESVEQFWRMLCKCWANSLTTFLILLIINLLCFSINLLPRDELEKYRFVQQLFLLFLVHLTDGVTLLPLQGVTHCFIVLRALPWAMRCCPCWAWLIASLSSGRCPGLCAAAPAGRRITICEYGGTRKCGLGCNLQFLSLQIVCHFARLNICTIFG